MEIKDPIHGSIGVSAAEVAILDDPAFQRLRLIKQLGFSEFSFPGATHNRYIHSLGVTHLAGKAFDSIFRKFKFSSADVRQRLRQCTRLAALLHDLGHGPLSHTTEEVMPPVESLKLDIYKYKKPVFQELGGRKATHEDYTLKIISDSDLTASLKEHFPNIDPFHICCLIDKGLEVQDDFFQDQGLDFRTVLSQIVSSEMDVDRMDYLARDSYFCGTNYGVIEFSWLLGNLSFHVVEGEAHLALNHRALYTFDDFLISRHHMYLMVYFHHKSIIFEEMLFRYLTSEDCDYHLPSDVNQYGKYTDYSLYEHMSRSPNPWAQRITRRDPYKMLFETHVTKEDQRTRRMKEALLKEGIDTIAASSRARLSKYHAGTPEDKSFQIYVVDEYDPKNTPTTIDKSTEIFQKYEETRSIERLYVDRKDHEKALNFIREKGL